jgi:hypothetical protein
LLFVRSFFVWLFISLLFGCFCFTCVVYLSIALHLTRPGTINKIKSLGVCRAEVVDSSKQKNQTSGITGNIAELFDGVAEFQVSE